MRSARWMTILILLGLLVVGGGTSRDTCEVKLSLVEDGTGKELPGLIRVTNSSGTVIEIPELFSRGTGLPGEEPLRDWYVLPGSRTIRLPQQSVKIEAFSGLETERTSRTLDLSDQDSRAVQLPLIRFHDSRARGQVAGNTHLHLMKLTRDDCDRYLREVPRTDGLDVVFLSYLERADADRDYISNRYTRGDLERLERDSGVLFGNGEEHRHNFSGFNQGYGHVMLLNIQRLILPVSIGPGIMKAGTDGLPLERGIRQARKDGATVVWCHNAWGREDVPNFVSGRVDAQNIFDGGNHGSYEDSFYRYLNAGIPVAFSTGTDWFMYDFSRVYVPAAQGSGVPGWLRKLAAGQSTITNGPLLELSVNGREPGQTVSLTQPGKVRIAVRGRGRANFGRIELVRNGQVISSAPARKAGGHWEAGIGFEFDLLIPQPCWLALRIPPVEDPAESAAVRRKKAGEPGRNEAGRPLFAHTGAVQVELGGRRHFDPQAGAALLADMAESLSEIGEAAQFADPQERARVLDVYRDGMAALSRHIAQCEKKIE